MLALSQLMGAILGFTVERGNFALSGISY